ncbi:MAG: thioredoxin [Candidatus Kapabacteria bacterium]|jgi:thioredoxin 1|nr:thioredoxin [Candidatus Kapabacteria bacterium]
MSKVLPANDANWQADVLDSQVPALVDFSAVWCGPCKMIEPHVIALADQYDGKAKFFKCDVDQAQQTAMKYGIRSIPAIMIFKDGQVVENIIGAVPKGQIEDALKAHL